MTRRCNSTNKTSYSAYVAFGGKFYANGGFSEQEHAVRQYDAWQVLRERAIKNNGGNLPEGYVEPYRAQPPPPSAVDDADIIDLSIELNAAHIDDVHVELDESGLERVPMADPGLDVRR